MTGRKVMETGTLHCLLGKGTKRFRKEQSLKWSGFGSHLWRCGVLFTWENLGSRSAEHHAGVAQHLTRSNPIRYQRWQELSLSNVTNGPRT